MLTFKSVLWKRGIIGSAVLFGLALMLALGNSIGAKPAVSGERLPLKGFDAPVPVRSIIQRACMDCHSNETVWPWYSNIPPISWQIHDDVQSARAMMNLSHWSDYTAEERRDFAMRIAGATRAGIMPPSRYLRIHRNARLSDAELDVLKEWALAGRERVE